MKLVTYASMTGPRAAAAREGAYVDLNQADPSLPSSLKGILELGEAGLRQAALAAANGQPIESRDVKLLAPIPDPQKILCIGLNYADHARESGMTPPPEPVVFSKLATTVLPPGDAIVLPEASQAVDYEAELVVIIGRAGRNIPAADARHYIAGYCPGNDVSARDWQLQKPGGQWLLGKSFDTFAPFGPALTTQDEVADPNNLRIQFRLNGRTLQDSNTDQFLFRVDQVVAYVSKVCTLLPGDCIFTGTPAGVGFARNPRVLLSPGDVCEVEIERLGILTNPVVAEAH